MLTTWRFSWVRLRFDAADGQECFSTTVRRYWSLDPTSIVGSE